MSKEIVIRSRTGSRLGAVVEESGQLVARDRVGRRLGFFEPKKNATYDRSSNRLVEGNILPTLIMDEAHRTGAA